MQGGQQADQKVPVVPLRIDCNSNVGVRRQQNFLRAKKVINSLSGVNSLLPYACVHVCMQLAVTLAAGG